jgi:hypothetical protein
VNVADLASWGILVSAVVAAFVLGAAPVFAVRWIARIYPPGHPRRAELVAEMAHVKGLRRTLELWRWMGEQFAVAICDGLPARRGERAASRAVEAPRQPTYTHTNSRGITYYLHKTTVTLRGGRPLVIYFMAPTEVAKGSPTDLPSDRVVKENPRNGFLTVSKRK